MSMSKFILGSAAFGILLLSRNTLTAFSDKLSPGESISLLLQTVVVLILSIYALHEVLTKEVPQEQRPDDANSQDQIQSRIMAYIQSQSKAKKHLSMEENLSVRWKMNKNVIAKIQMFSDYILRDFIKFWYYGITNDDCVLNDIELCLGNAFGMLLMRGRLGLNPITFTFDKCFQTLARMLAIHREAKDAAAEKHTKTGSSASSELEALKLFRRAAAEEVRQRQRLHPMFYLPVEWDEKVSGHFKGGDPSELSEQDFFNSQRIKACEAKYYQYLGKHLTKVLLVEKDDLNCKVVRHLITELMGSCILHPIFNLFTPLVVHKWISYGLTPANSANEEVAPKSRASAPVTTKEPISMADFSAPPGFSPDRCWAYFKSAAREHDVANILLKQAAGTFVIISLNDNDLFSLICTNEDAETSTKGLYHVPFMGYTTDPSGFQICLLSSDEYFPVSKGPPAAIELLNGSLFLTLDQMVVALSSIATSGLDFGKLTASSDSLPENKEAENGDDNAPEASVKGEGQSESGEGGAGDNTANKESSSDEEDFSVRERRVLSHNSTACDDKELYMEQERLVMLYELQGAVDEFQDALQFCESQKKPVVSLFGNSTAKKTHDDRQPINLSGDKTAIRALKRFILCLEDIIFHGFSAHVDITVESSIELPHNFMLEALTGSPFYESDRKISIAQENDLLATPNSSKKSGFSLKTMVKRAMSTKRAELAPDLQMGEHQDSLDQIRRPSLRTSTSILGMLNLLDRRYSFNWFWLEILKSPAVSFENKGDGIVSSASAKLRRLSNSRKDDSIPVVQRLYNSWTDLFSNHLLLSIEDCQQEISSSDHAVRTSTAVDKNCLRVFLYDSLVQGKLVERVGRVVRLATKEVVVEIGKQDVGTEFIIPSFYNPAIVRGQWSPHSVLTNEADIAKLLSSLAPLIGTSVVLPPSTAPAEAQKECSDANEEGHGLRSFINSSSLLGAFSDISLRPGDVEGENSDNTLKNKQREERIIFSRRFRSRRQAVDQAWAHRMLMEGNGVMDSATPKSSSKRELLKQTAGKSLAKVGHLLSSKGSGDHDVNEAPTPQKQHDNRNAKGSLSVEIAGSDGEESDDSVSEFQATVSKSTPERLTSKVGKSSSSKSMRTLVSKEMRRQELLFRLEMLMSGRPSIQALMELKLWMPTSKTFEVNVVRAELEDDPTGLTIAGSSMQQVVVYALAVVCRDTYPEPSPTPIEEGKAPVTPDAKSWIIRKRYSDFDDLHKQLKLFVSSRVMLHLPLPQKQYINVGGMGSGSAAFVEKRRQRLQDYMDCVLKYLSACDEVKRFLDCDSMKEGDDDLSLKTPMKVLNEHRMRQSVLDEIRSGGKGNVSGTHDATTTASIDSDVVSQPVERGASRDVSSIRLEPNGHAENDFLMRGVANTEFDSRTTRLLEARIFELIKEVLDVDNMNVLRRNFVALLHQSVRIFFSTTLKTWASAQAKESVSDANLTWLLDYVLQIVWPKGTLIVAAPIVVADEKEQAAELLKLRKSNMAEILALLPAGLLSNSLGDGKIDKAIDRIFDLIDNPVLLKSLIFIVVDMLLIEMFPELRPFLSGMDTLSQN